MIPMARFEPTTDRGRVYAACVDWQHAAEYLAAVESDPECCLFASAYRLCNEGPNVAGNVVAKILEQPADSWGNKLFAVLALTKPGGVWFRELAAEQSTLTQGSKEPTL